tara:strand:+ start:362 stop:1534 length:1173 start_codon:yes stop_codon:yes gene_type:complete
MSAQSNAILAINSLDRYTLLKTDEFSNFNATWVTGVPTITYVTGERPIVGSVLTAAGIPLGTAITAVNGNIVTINQNTTTTQAAPLYVFQTTSTSTPSQPVANFLFGLFNNAKPYANDFTIQSPGALIYGYIKKIIVSQVQIQYNIPTINGELNDEFYFIIGAPTFDLYKITIPYGFYYPDELAAILQVTIRATNSTTGGAPVANMNVTFDRLSGFAFSSATTLFRFLTPDELLTSGTITKLEAPLVYKTYRVLGITIGGTQALDNVQVSNAYPNFLYTPYIDIYSDILTNYQKIKDTNTSVQKPKGLVARIYLSGVGDLQQTRIDTGLGCAAFVMTADLNTPKVIGWTPDVAVPSIDFQLRDCYGDLLPGADYGFSTEFQMTLLCVEEE